MFYAFAYLVLFTACCELLEPICIQIQSQASLAVGKYEVSVGLLSLCLPNCITPKSHQVLVCALMLTDKEN